MKPIYTVLVFVLLIPMSLPGQSGRKKSGHNKKSQTDVPAEEFGRQLPSINDSLSVTPYYFPDTLFRRYPGRDRDEFIFRYPGKRYYRVPDIREEPEIYPGAQKFYRKSRPMPSPYEKSFIIPHVASRDRKYHLIIKDPITHRIIN